MGISIKGIGNALGRAGQAAVNVAPYAAKMLHDRQQQDEADRQRMLTQFYQLNQDRRAEMASSLAYQQGGANVLKTNAQTTKLQEPTPSAVTYKQDASGNFVALPSKVAPSQSVTPMQTGVKAPAKPPTSEPLVPVVQGGKRVWMPRSKAAGTQAPEPAAPQSSFTPFQGTDDSGKPVVRPFNTKTGQFGPVADVAPKVATGSAGSAPMAAKVGQAGEMLKKTADLLPLMEGLGVSLGQSASADIAQNGIGVGHARIPGTRGLGSELVNRTPSYAQYQAALSPLVLAAAHALSGARINQDQVNQIRQSIEIAPGDIKNPQVIEQKRKNMLDLVNSIAGSLPADAIGAQEGQIDPSALATLEGHGYIRATTRRGNTNLGAPGNSARPASHDPSGNIDLRASGATREQQLWDAAVAKHGKAKVMQEYGPRPGGDEE